MTGLPAKMSNEDYRRNIRKNNFRKISEKKKEVCIDFFLQTICNAQMFPKAFLMWPQGWIFKLREDLCKKRKR
jgi:hypothetical protein